jgi:hypothetical protein
MDLLKWPAEGRFSSSVLRVELTLRRIEVGRTTRMLAFRGIILAASAPSGDRRLADWESMGGLRLVTVS